jgi:hypothetical protein
MNFLRIPEYKQGGFDGMLMWFAEMSVRDLLFHPDEKPEALISIHDGKAIFSNTECYALNQIIKDMFHEFGEQVYEAAYPIIMKRFGIQLDA